MVSGAARLVRDAAPIFAALGDPVRLRVVSRLSGEGPLSIVQLAEDSGVSRQAVRKHLDVLERAGLVRARAAGRERRFELATTRLQEARRHLETISSKWDETLGRLKAFVEE